MGGGTSKESKAATGVATSSKAGSGATTKNAPKLASSKGDTATTNTESSATPSAAAIGGTPPQTLDLQTAITPVTGTRGPETPDEVQAYACNEDDLKDGEMREVEVGGEKVLLVRENGEFHAIGPKCSHFGAPLVKGALCNGHVRCPWHGACFNIRTGDIEDFPGLDSIQKFEVDVSDGKVRVRAGQSALSTKKRLKHMTCSAPEEDSRTFLIVGGGGATIACAETLRQEGFKGKVIVATRETCMPYDRTTLSKALQKKPEEMAVRSPDFYSVYDIQVKTDHEATSVDTEQRCVTFKNGEKINYDKLLIATGGSPRMLPIPGSDLENVCVLRTPTDANHIARETMGKNVVIIGTSFIGMEVAASVASKAQSVTALDIVDIPFKMVLGADVGSSLKKLHEEKGVKFIAGNSAKELVGENGRLKEVILEDGTVLPADVLVMGVGVYPTTAFLKDSGIEMSDRGYVIVDKHMQTNKENVYAAGDIVEFPLFMLDDQRVNVQHWQMAHAHGRCAALNMVDQNTEIKSVPFFWTMMYGKSVRYTGYGAGYDDIVHHGDDSKFVSFYTKGDNVVAIASLGWDPICAQAAEMFYAGKTITKAEVQSSPDGWVSRLH